MKVRTRAILLGVLPALCVGGMLLTYLSMSRLADLEAGLLSRGAALARYLALGSQYGVVSGNVASMRPMLETAAREPNVVHIGLYRPDGGMLAEVGKPVSTLCTVCGAYRPFDQGIRSYADYLVFSVPVLIASPRVDDLFIPQGAGEPSPVGWVQVTLSRSGNRRVAQGMLWNGLLIMTLGMLIATVLVRRLALTGVRPLMEIIDGVRSIADGKLMVRLPLTARSELRDLQAGINAMSDKLVRHEQEMRDRVESATAALELQKDAAERANTAKSKFLAAASHDLRQPLHALGLFVHALKQRHSGTEDRHLVEQIEASVLALSEMFNTLLDLSRLEAGTVVPEVRAFRLQELFDQLGLEYGVQVEEKMLRLVIRPTRVVVRSDPILLRQILSNLVCNAVRYTESGGVLVAARRRQGAICVQVIDTGLGISAEALPHIYEEYFQADNPARNRNRGLGLGLNIARRICGLLSLHLTVRSERGRGTAFSLLLPEETQEGLEEPSDLPAEEISFQGERVLVVEDDMGILAAIHVLLSEWGLEVAAVKDIDGVRSVIAAKFSPSLVISDFQLPDGITGIEVIALAREMCQFDVPAILLTGDTTPEGSAVLSASGIPVLVKPTHPNQLLHAIHAVLRGSALH